MISVAVMAHPKRAAWVDELTSRLDAEATVVWDKRGDEWDTGARAWHAHDPAADWHLVVQDDAIVCDRLVARLADRLDGLDHDGPVSLYLGTGRPWQAEVRAAIGRAHGGWVRMPWLLWGVAFAVPVRHIRSMLADLDGRPQVYDRRISTWWEARRAQTWYTWPCLVDHRDSGSLVGHDTPVRRRAHQWIDAPSDTPPTPSGVC